ncbi:hypothetical protein predicted by Glimmer/Critica (plasmid) [Sinorhizobium fredii HH103]|uniref:Uncharacterized protein n=1 Tax=Sinorhizobium fredii (strain HH103) TaxID=1117943 RepID=G9AEH2_SINF1|nr:hypothetical protein predicted by Glimmer/Critica [Sinorhizobium fredii HH103]
MFYTWETPETASAPALAAEAALLAAPPATARPTSWPDRFRKGGTFS